MLRLARWILPFMIVLLAGCVSNIKLDPVIKSKLDEGIAIDPIVTIVDQPYFHGRKQTWGMALGGAIGGAVVGAATSEPAKIKQYLTAEEIDVSSIVLDEFKRQIKNRSDFSDRIRDDGKFRLQLEIPMYGIAVTNAFTSNYKPTLGLRAKLVDPAGEIIWQKYDYISTLNSKTPGQPYDGYFNNPETFKVAFMSAAEIVVSLVLENLE